MTRTKFPIFLRHCCILVSAYSLTPASRRPNGRARGALTVTVSDPSGGVIAGATVAISNGAGRNAPRQTTAGSGSYTFTLLPPGTYKV